MSEEGRPDPDELLERIRETEGASSRAELKIFFGMSAGVGKTYAMLQEARAAKAQGIDIAVGIVETHGRPDTEALVAGLELVPLRQIEYRGILLEELDLDALVARRPAIAIVDELAHANAPGSRHVKRWQDVLELVDRGISVWTAINVQHMESFADVVEDLTGARVRERVPDTLFDRADEVRLIDVAPEDLIRRLEEGAIYTGESTRAAIENFFRPKNLGALREIALRFAARTASRRLSEYARSEIGAESGSQHWASLGERVLVAVGPAPGSAYLVRWARRTAYSLRAEWTAVHVDTGALLSEADKGRLEANLSLARKLGAEVLVVPGSDVAEAVIATARAKGASLVVVGRSGLSSLGFLPKRATVSDRIVREAAPIDIAVVQDSSSASPERPLDWLKRVFGAPKRQYALLIAAFTALALLAELFVPVLGYRSVALLFLAAVLGLSFIARPGPVALFGDPQRPLAQFLLHTAAVHLHHQARRGLDPLRRLLPRRLRHRQPRLARAARASACCATARARPPSSSEPPSSSPSAPRSRPPPNRPPDSPRSTSTPRPRSSSTAARASWRARRGARRRPESTSASSTSPRTLSPSARSAEPRRTRCRARRCATCRRAPARRRPE